ncbi:hypothetical protein [Nonomuraea recticatena]|uniref:Uncharacterized protein n=1 Tax=Nonomuraea recticatena TaxID=46178 RepID=A0ABP6FUZ7_9ACTN
MTVGLSALEFEVLQTPAYGWDSARTLIPMGVGVLALATFALVQARFARAPLMPLRIFRARSVSGARVSHSSTQAPAAPHHARK